MNLTDDQIVRFLIDKYKQEGKDLSFLLSDPVFGQLPLGSKVEALKKYAAELAAGSRVGFNKQDWLATGKSALIGAATGTFAANKFVNSKVVQDLAKSKGLGLPSNLASLLSRKGFITAGTIGALGGLAYAGLSAREAVSARKQVRSNLEQLAKNPTDKQGIYAIVNHSKYPATEIKSYSTLDKLKEKLLPLASQHAGEQAGKMVNNDVNAIIARIKETQQG